MPPRAETGMLSRDADGGCFGAVPSLSCSLIFPGPGERQIGVGHSMSQSHFLFSLRVTEMLRHVKFVWIGF